uniref:Uncharacterized protein n=1 Tax=Helianthus annuus TaxID=4232 RepID=A0A251UVM2_HELAN
MYLLEYIHCRIDTYSIVITHINRPLPTSVSSYKGSSDEFTEANVQLALAVVRKLQEIRETRARIV